MTKTVHISDSVVLHLADCRDILTTMPDGSVKSVVTDPPYGTQELTGGYGRKQLYNTGDGYGRTIENDEDLTMITDAYPELRRIVGVGWMTVFFSCRIMPDFIDATSRDDWYGELIWNKYQPGLGFHIRYSHESIGVFRIGEPERPKDPILSVIGCHQLSKIHPHQKPVPLLKRIVEWVSSPGEVILDPFMGIGSTGVACAETGRSFVGIEIDENYFDIACQRIDDALKQPRLFA